jgi:hypothetical protein
MTPEEELGKSTGLLEIPQPQKARVGTKYMNKPMMKNLFPNREKHMALP